MNTLQELFDECFRVSQELIERDGVEVKAHYIVQTPTSPMIYIKADVSSDMAQMIFAGMRALLPAINATAYVQVMEAWCHIEENSSEPRFEILYIDAWGKNGENIHAIWRIDAVDGKRKLRPPEKPTQVQGDGVNLFFPNTVGSA